MASSYKFITLNILEGGLFFDNIIEFFDKEKPDIVVMQEVTNGKDSKSPRHHRSLEELKKYFKNYNYHYVSDFIMTKHSPIEPLEFGNAIFSRFPIKNTSVTYYNASFNSNYTKPFQGADYSDDPCDIQHAEIDINGTIVNVFNTHGVWGLEGGDNDRRLAMSEAIVKEIKDRNNVILAGDFNVRPNTKTIESIEKHLINVFKNELTSTFNMRHKEHPGYATSVVDMIFVSPTIKILEHICPDVDVSDHYPLVCTFSL